MTLLRLATHVAELPGWLFYTIDTPELDFAKRDYNPPVTTDNDSLLKTFEDNLTTGTKSLENTIDETWLAISKLRNGYYIFFELSTIWCNQRYGF